MNHMVHSYLSPYAATMIFVIFAAFVGWVTVYPALISRKELRSLSAYKIMISLGINDMLGAMAWGTPAYIGGRTDKADEQTLQILRMTGHAIVVTWFTMIMHINIMAVNRFVVLLTPRWKWIFEKRKIYTYLDCSVLDVG